MQEGVVAAGGSAAAFSLPMRRRIKILQVILRAGKHENAAHTELLSEIGGMAGTLRVAGSNDPVPARLPFFKELLPAAGGVILCKVNQQRGNPVHQAVGRVHRYFIAYGRAKHDLLPEMIETGAVLTFGTNRGNNVIQVIRADHMIAHGREAAVECTKAGGHAAGASYHDQQPVLIRSCRGLQGDVRRMNGFQTFLRSLGRYHLYFHLGKGGKRQQGKRYTQYKDAHTKKISFQDTLFDILYQRT